MTWQTATLDKLCPRRVGLRMPAEWEPHRATWMVWPHSWHDWGCKLSIIHWCFVEIVRRLSSNERVAIIVKNDSLEARARMYLTQMMVNLSDVEFYTMSTNRSWIRDNGPIFVVRTSSSKSQTEEKRELAITDWGFNSWAKYSNWKMDNEIPQRLAETLGVRRFQPQVEQGSSRHDLILEGGSIDVNGEGLLLTTEDCLLSNIQARNPGVSRQTIEDSLRVYLGVGEIIWLNKGIAGDDTNGHVDDIARFVGALTVAIAVEEDPSDENYSPLQENRERLESITTIDGHRLNLVPIPMPKPLYFEKQRLPASYLNFYIANGQVLVPTFNDPADRIALGRFADLFPDREIIGIHAVDLVLGLGALHCLTLQEPS